MSSTHPPKVAVIHDWLVTEAGSEKVLLQILNLFPEADLYTSIDFLSHGHPLLQKHRIHTSFLQNFPYVKRLYQSYLFLMPYAFEQFNLSQYDVVISSSHSFSKGVITGPGQLHISYVHTPMRYAWDQMHEYFERYKFGRLKKILASYVLHKIRLWDHRTSNGVDHFLANSEHIAKRIWKHYRREADVIYPNVDLDYFQCYEDKQGFYLTASRLVPYKAVMTIAEAFTKMPDKELVIIGDGPDMEKIRAMKTPNIKLMGYQPGRVLRGHMQRARAFVYAAIEDFGIVPVEAQACGTPVIALGHAGTKETVIDGVTGVHFEEQNALSIQAAVERFETLEFDAQAIRLHAENFSTEKFRERFCAKLEACGVPCLPCKVSND